jgi:hypothetical protein
MRHDQRIVVDVDDATPRRGRLGDFVGVVGRGQPGADVEELTDPCLGGQVADDADQEPALGARGVNNVWQGGTNPLADLAIDRVIVPAAQPIVPDPSRVRLSDVDIRKPFLAGSSRQAARHDATSLASLSATTKLHGAAA